MDKDEERKNLLHALELRVHLAKKNRQGFVDLTYTMAERIIDMLKESDRRNNE